MKEIKDFKIQTFVGLLANLNIVLSDAGGGPLSIEALSEMSAIDLLALIAPNHIHFCFTASSG